MEKKEYTLDLGGRPLTLRFLNWTEQSNGSVVAVYGDTVVLTTVVMGGEREGLNYFPLTVDYRERYYAAGKIGGGRFMKREGRPGDEATLKARLIDRTLRPLFDQRMRREVQVVNTILSYDSANTPDMLSLISSSVALLISSIPWDGPIAAVRVGRSGDDWILNPSNEAIEEAQMSIVVAGTADAVNMLEVGAQEVGEDEVLQGIAFGADHIQKIIDFQNKIRDEIGKEKEDIVMAEASEELKKEVKDYAESRLKSAFTPDAKETTSEVMDALKLHLKDKYGKDDPAQVGHGLDYLDKVGDEIVHSLALKENKRADGRKLDEVRSLSADVAVLPRTHGTGLFMRGLTHALSVATLAAPGNEELSDAMEGEGKKRFMHHYNFPSFATGETGFFRGPGRREIGHGALAEKALRPIIPAVEDFPYVIRLVSEIFSSNGSSSMASVCGSSLALMDAGVPIKSHVAGIAMGLMSEKSGKYKVLSDIQGPEDHHGDMDLKIAGTKKGVTAVQMDIKIDGVSLDILRDSFTQAKKARLEILEVLESAIGEPRETLSPYAPLIRVLQISPSRIGDVIGPGGKMIRGIIEETGIENIDIEEDGKVFVSGLDQEAVKRAVKWIEDLTHEVVVGEKFNATVVKIADFGAFVELLPGQDALVHVSELNDDYVKNVSDVVSVGDKIQVKIIKIDQGKISASAKNLGADIEKKE